ncbi:calcofluor white hypersensitive protein [Apiospora arundinis]
MSRSRMPLVLGLGAAGGVGYYLYSAGGNPKVAQKKAEADAHKLSAEAKSHIPGRTSQAEKDAEKFGAQAGAKFDNVASKTQADLSKVKAEAENLGKDLKQDALKKVDQFDRKVETKTAEAKSGISSWFGGSK